MKTRRAQAWIACNKLTKIWKSSLNKKLKLKLFVAAVESIFLYGSETWTINKKTEKMIDGTYTRMLRAVRNISWKDHITNEELYGCLPKLSIKIRERRMRLAGHCLRHSEEEASKLVLWDPQHGSRGQGRPRVTFIDNLRDDTST